MPNPRYDPVGGPDGGLLPFDYGYSQPLTWGCFFIARNQNTKAILVNEICVRICYPVGEIQEELDNNSRRIQIS
jgi:hypothetical protein